MFDMLRSPTRWIRTARQAQHQWRKGTFAARCVMFTSPVAAGLHATSHWELRFEFDTEYLQISPDGLGKNREALMQKNPQIIKTFIAVMQIQKHYLLYQNLSQGHIYNININKKSQNKLISGKGSNGKGLKYSKSYIWWSFKIIV